MNGRHVTFNEQNREIVETGFYGNANQEGVRRHVSSAENRTRISNITDNGRESQPNLKRWCSAPALMTTCEFVSLTDSTDNCAASSENVSSENCVGTNVQFHQVSIATTDDSDSSLIFCDALDEFSTITLQNSDESFPVSDNEEQDLKNAPSINEASAKTKHKIRRRRVSAKPRGVRSSEVRKNEPITSPSDSLSEEGNSVMIWVQPEGSNVYIQCFLLSSEMESLGAIMRVLSKQLGYQVLSLLDWKGTPLNSVTQIQFAHIYTAVLKDYPFADSEFERQWVSYFSLYFHTIHEFILQIDYIDDELKTIFK